MRQISLKNHFEIFIFHIIIWRLCKVHGLCKAGGGQKIFLPVQYQSWRWMVSSLDLAMNREQYRSNRSRQHDKWWYLELKRWSHDINQQHHQISMSSWYNQPIQCTYDRHCLCQHQHPSEYGRNLMGRRSKEM